MPSRAAAPIALALALALSPGAHAESVAHKQADQTLWSGSRGTLTAEPCAAGSSTWTRTCLVWIDGAHRAAMPTMAGSPAQVHLIWQARRAAHGPDLLAFADSGGSFLCGEYIAVLFDTDPHFQTITDCGQHSEAIDDAPLPSGRFGFELFIPAGSRFGGPTSTARSAAVPVIWHHGTFTLDSLRLQARPASATGDSRRQKAITNETKRFVEANPSRDDGLPDTTQAMLDLIVMGRATKAHKMLLQNADRRFDAARYWSDLCAGLVADGNWATLLHDHLPQSRVIEDAAKGGDPHRLGDDYVLTSPRRGHG